MPRRGRPLAPRDTETAQALCGRLALRSARPGQPWHAEIVAEDGRVWRFDDLPSLVLFMVRVSIDPEAQSGLR